MSIRRVMPDIHVASGEALTANRAFYGLLGFEEVMDMGWVVTLASPANPTAQISFLTEERTAPVVPDLSVEVEDVDAVYTQVVASGAEVVRELRDEEWGVRRFFVRDPNGRVVNVLTHKAGEVTDPSGVAVRHRPRRQGHRSRHSNIAGHAPTFLASGWDPAKAATYAAVSAPAAFPPARSRHCWAAAAPATAGTTPPSCRF